MNLQVYSFAPDQMKAYVEDLINSDMPERQQSVLQSLFDYITRKRHQWNIHLQKLIYIFFDLAFNLHRHSLIKQILKAYRMVTQSQYTESLKSVLLYYRDERLQIILDRIKERPFEQIVEIEDIESEESPEDLLISSFKILEKRQRDELKSDMRIVWDGYKSIIETVRINQKLQDLYIETLQKLFEFAHKYNRKHEFKRFCDTLRTGLQNIIKTKQDKTDAQRAIFIDIENTEVNERSIGVRLEQFEVATNLGLWQESFQILEDINLLMRARKGVIKKPTLSRYYLNLSRLFRKSSYWNYHAFTYFNYYDLYRRNPNLTAKDHNIMTDELLLSVMCIPPFSIQKNQNEQSQNKICSLVTSTNHIPDRAELYKLVLQKGILESASEHIKKLWAFLFLEFKILEVPEKLGLLKEVRESVHQEFATLIENVIIYQELIEISKIYSKVKFDNILKMIPFGRERVMNVLLTTREREVLQFQFDEINNLIIFKEKQLDTDPYLILTKLSRDITFAAERVHKPDEKDINRLAQLFLGDAKDLYQRIRPHKSFMFHEQLKKPMKQLRQEQIQRERKEQEERQKEEKLRKQQDADNKRREILRQKDLATKRDIIKDIIKMKEKRVVKHLGKKIEAFDENDLEDVTIDQLNELLKETEKKKKEDADNKYKKAFTKVDYTERARRQAVEPLVKTDWANSEVIVAQTAENRKGAFEKQLAKKNKYLPAKDLIEKQLEQQTRLRREQYDKDLAAYKARITLEYKQRIIARANELREAAKQEKIRLEEERVRRANLPASEDTDGGWRRIITTTTPAAPAATTAPVSDPFSFRSKAPQQPVASTATVTTPSPANTTEDSSGWRTQKPPSWQAPRGSNPLFRAAQGGGSTTTATTATTTGFNFRDKIIQPASTTPPTATTTATTGLNFRDKKPEEPKKQIEITRAPKKDDKKPEPPVKKDDKKPETKDLGGWRRN